MTQFFVETRRPMPMWHLPTDLVSLSFVFGHIFLLFYWLSCYARIRLKGKLHKSRFRFYCQVVGVFVVSGIVLYGILAGLHGVLYGVESPYEVYKWVVLCAFFPFVTLLLALVFCFVVLKTLSEMSMWINKAQGEYRYLKRVGVIVALSLIVLYFKSLAMAVVEIPDVTTLFGSVDENSGILQFVVLVVFECLPTVATLMTLRSDSPITVQRQQNLKEQDKMDTSSEADVLSDSQNDTGLFI